MLRKSDVASWSKDKSGKRWNALDSNGVLVGTVIAGCGYYRPCYRQVDGVIQNLDGEPWLQSAQSIVERCAVSPSTIAASLEVPVDWSVDSRVTDQKNARIAVSLAAAINRISNGMGLGDILDHKAINVSTTIRVKGPVFSAQLPGMEIQSDWGELYATAVLEAINAAEITGTEELKVQISAVTTRAAA
jgi:hypothetical protein